MGEGAFTWDQPPAGAVWRAFGLRRNPFFTSPLASAAGVDRGIHLFRGAERSHEADKIVNRILNDENTLRLIEGPNGIGKTTLANLIKAKLRDREDTAIFPEVIQIHVKGTTPAHFAAEILYATVIALRNHPKAKDASREANAEAEGKVLDRIVTRGHKEFSLSYLLGVKWTRTLFLREAEVRPFADWHRALLNVQRSAAASGIDRLVIHINNLDQATITDADRVGDLFGTVRDLLQMDGYHYIMCASEPFRMKALEGRANVLDILGTPLRPSPLSSQDVQDIIEVRYTDARLEDTPLIEPIPPSQVADLVELFQGELRAVLEILGQTFMEEIGPMADPQPLSAHEVIDIQRPILESLLGSLSDAQRRVLTAIADLTKDHGPVRQKELVNHLGEGFSQGYISQIADSLVADRWISKHNPNQRTTYYSLGGRARIIRDNLAKR